MRRYVQAVRLCCLLLLPLVLTNSAVAKIIHVPADQPTIQSAINVATNGDKVLVAPGTYKENINFLGKNIAVVSSAGASKTIIDGGQLDTVVRFVSGESRQAILSGFTVQNAGFNNVSAIDIENSSPTLEYNIITANNSCYPGIAINSNYGGPQIHGNLIANNNGQCYFGSAITVNGGTGANVKENAIVGNYGGISLQSSTATVVVGNVVSENRTGIYTNNLAGDALITQNLIASNQAEGLAWDLPPGRLLNNTIANNEGSGGQFASEINATAVNNQLVLQNNLIIATGTMSAFYCGSYDMNNPPVIANNDIFAASGVPLNGSCPDSNGKRGNISSDPLFVSFLSDNFHLQSGSPAIDAGKNTSGLPALDFDGDPRILNIIVDMGVDEFSSNTALTLSSYKFDFGSVALGQSSLPQVLTFSNNSNSDVTIRLLGVGAEFSQVNNCGQKLMADASCQMKVRFVPNGSGTRKSAVALVTDTGVNPLVAVLSGNGLVPKVDLVPYYINFPEEVIGSTNYQSSTLTNTGEAPLSISSISGGDHDVTQTNDCPIAPATLAPEAYCTITVAWTPTVVGYENTEFTITDNAPDSPQTLSVSGQSYSAGIPSLSPPELDFPGTLVGNTSSPQLMTLTNTGTGPLGNISVFSYADFPETNNCPTTLAVGASCTITISFAPSGAGPEQSYVDVFTDAYWTSGILTGTGISPVPAISSLSPDNVAAGSSDTPIIVNGTGFVPNAQGYFNGTILQCSEYGTTQMFCTVPAAYLTLPGTAEIKVFNPAPGGGYSNVVTFTIYQPVNYLSKSLPFHYRQITGTNLNLQYGTAVYMAAPFTLQFGGGSFDHLSVGAGGTIVPGSSSGSYGSEFNDPLPTCQLPLAVAPMWSQLYPFGSGSDNNVFWDVIGTPPNREFVLEWRDVTYCCSQDSTDTVKFQVVFFEGNSNVLFNYADTTFGGQYSFADNGAQARVGMQVSPTIATQYSYDTPSLHDKMSLLWYPDNPTASLSTTTLDFGYHLVGTNSTAQKFTLTNGGLVPLQISSVGIDNPDFAQQNNCGQSVPPKGSCSFLVKFTPSQPSAENATLTITDNATNSPQTVMLSGIGASTSTVIFPVLLNFGNVSVGQNKTLPVTLANALNSPMTIQEISTSPSVYTQTNDCG